MTRLRFMTSKREPETSKSNELMHNSHNMKRYALIAAACSLALSISAQDLTKEITVEKDYVPVERKATKQNVLPTVSTNPADMNATLNYSDWAIPATVSPSIPTVTPYGYQTVKDFDTRRGYATLGVGTQLNVLGSIGYRVLDTRNNQLDIWYQHNSTWLGKNSSPISDQNEKQKFNDNIIGANFLSNFYEGVLKIDAMFNVDNFNYYALPLLDNAVYRYSNDVLGSQTFTQFFASGSWQSRDHGQDYCYGLAAGLGHGAFNKSAFEGYDGLAETDFYVKANADYHVQDNVEVGADINFDLTNYSKTPGIDLSTFKFTELQHSTIALTKISPFLRYQREDVLLQLGLNLDVAVNSGSTLRISPNVKAGYNFSHRFGIYLDLKGGKSINHMYFLKAQNRYINPGLRYDCSYTPLDAEAGFDIGGWGGFTAKIFGGFASYNNVLTPFCAAAPAQSSTSYDIDAIDLMSTVIYAPTKLSGWKAGAELRYKYRSIVDASARFVYSPQDNGDGCVLGLDRPEYVVNANVRITPIQRLALNLGYEMRGNRGIYSMQNVNDKEYWECFALEDVMDLSFSASYDVLDNLTVSAYANNLLNRQYDIFASQGAQKLNVMLGASVRF